MQAKRFILMLLVMLGSVTGAWAEYVPYVDADGTVKVVNASEITSTTSFINLGEGWFVVKGTDVQVPKITCQRAVNIIIADGAQLTVTSRSGSAIGITRDNSSLTIYGQSAQTGRLTANALDGVGAAIEADSNCDNIFITVNGGIVTANGGGNSAGIGGGSGGSGSNITINGGIVTANGGRNGAGIGGGSGGSGSNITINGGIVTATGGEYGAGIGGGRNGNGSNITINGGIVTANSGDMYSAGIGGGGYDGSGSNITINGGIVTANNSGEASGIGGAYNGSSSNIFVTPALRVRADDSNPPVNVIAHSSITEDISSLLNGKHYVRITDQALFKLRSSDSHKGKVFGVEDGEYARNTTLHFCAVPTDGYKFKGWSDGNTDNPRQYILTDDTSITANFEVVNVFQDPTGAGMRLKVTKKDNKVYEFKTQDVKSVDYYRANE